MPKLLPSKEKIQWQGGVTYFLTSSTFLHYPYFRLTEQKQIALNKIKELKVILKIPIFAFSIGINHLHLKFFANDEYSVTKVKTFLHSGISREYKKIYQIPYKEFWQSTKTLYKRRRYVLENYRVYMWQLIKTQGSQHFFGIKRKPVF